jgi:hypothetical protein
MMTIRFTAAAALGAAAIVTTAAGAASAHGVVGSRFFPATILTDDPFVADEASLPTLTRPPTDRDGTQGFGLDWDIAKRLTPDFGISLGQGWKYLQPRGLPAASGLDALHAGVAYQFLRSPALEATARIGLNATFGHTGRVATLGAPDFTTLTPTLAFGKGFGDLPPSLPWLRPIAVTGNLSLDLPTKTTSAGSPNPNFLNYGFAFEYSLEYLQHQVKDVGLRPPFDRLIPLVEVSFATGLNRGAGGRTVGTIQPGVIWAGQYMQVGAELIIPATRAAGRGVGGVVQLHFYLDDIFPMSLGRPLFRN